MCQHVNIYFFIMKIKIKYEKVEPNIEILMLSFKFTKIREVSIY